MLVIRPMRQILPSQPWGGRMITSNISISIVGTDLVVTGTTNKSLANGRWGFKFGVNVTPAIWWEDAAGTTSSQTITVPLAFLGSPGDTIYVQAGYSLTDPAGTIVLIGTETSVVYPSYIGLESSADFLLMETGDFLLMETGASTDISAMTAASALDGTEKWAIVQSGVTVYATTDQLRTYING